MPCHGAFRRGPGSDGGAVPAGVSLRTAERRIPGFRSRLPPASVRQAFNRARRFFEFVGAELGRCDLDRVDQALLDRYAKLLRNGRCRPVIVAQLLEVIFDLHAYRAHLPNAALPFEPWPGRSPSQVAGYRYVAEENRTPRMPEAVITPLLAWSLKYVTLFSRDIFAAREELLKLEERQRALAAADAVLPPDQRRARRRARLTEFSMTGGAWGAACRYGPLLITASSAATR